MFGDQDWANFAIVYQVDTYFPSDHRVGKVRIPGDTRRTPAEGGLRSGKTLRAPGMLRLQRQNFRIRLLG